MSKCIWIALCAAAVACTPKLSGVCSSNTDCKIGESCNADGICLRGNDGTGGGDAGTAAFIEILSPQSGAIEKGTFHVSAQTASAVAVDSVNFRLASASNGNQLGTLLVTTSSASTWSGDLVVSVASFGGAANLVAVLQRAGLPDMTSSPITVTIDQNAPSISATWSGSQWWPLGASLALTAAVADDRSGVASAALILPDGGTTPGRIAGGVATFQLPASAVGSAGAAVVVPVSLSASDLAGNQTLNSAAANLQIDDQPPSISLQALDPAVWRNGPLDVNANLNDGTGSGLASTSLLLGGAFTSGTPDGGGGYNYHANLSTLAPTEAAVILQVLGTDAVGNQADAGFTINVDNVPPAVTIARIDTAFDGTDSASQGWFSGPTAAPSAGAIAVSALISDTNLVTTGANAPAAVVGATRYAGTLASGRWSFSIPRSVGLNATAPVAVSFDAQDLAGNHPVSPASISLQFDDVPAASFKPAIASDTSWHARTGSLAIGVSFGTAPRSGFASVLLDVNGQTGVTCTSSSALSSSCALPTADATALAEGPLSFSVAAKSVTTISSSNIGFRNIDDAAPVISNASAIPYPAGTAWGHNGSHFTLRDSGVLYTFTAYDCGSGLNTTPVSFGFSPQLSTRSASITATGTQTCPSGGSATLYSVAVSGDLSTSTPGSFAGADNTFSVSATVQDNVGHQSGSTQSAINATRRLWQTGNIGATGLAVGPTLVVATSGGLNGFALSNGAAQWSVSATVASGPVVGGTAATPLVYYGTAGSSTDAFAINATIGSAVGSCGAEPTLTIPSGCPISTAGLSRTKLLAVASDGTGEVLESAYGLGITTAGADCSASGYRGTRVTGCATWAANTTRSSGSSDVGDPGIDALTIGRSSHAFFLVNNAPGATIVEEPVTGGSTVSASTACSSAMVMTDNGGNDAPLCNGGRSTFTTGFTSNWSAAVTPLLTAPSAFDRFLTSVSGLSISSGTSQFSLSGIPWAVDGSATPVLYFSSGVAVNAAYLSSAGVGGSAWGLPTLPGTSVSDLVMDKSGVLYVASGGQVSAIATDSPGLGTNGSGWPVRAHDACRSSNLEYSCPW